MSEEKTENHIVSSSDKVESIRNSLFTRGGYGQLCFGVVLSFCLATLWSLEFQRRLGRVRGADKALRWDA